MTKPATSWNSRSLSYELFKLGVTDRKWNMIYLPLLCKIRALSTRYLWDGRKASLSSKRASAALADSYTHKHTYTEAVNFQWINYSSCRYPYNGWWSVNHSMALLQFFLPDTRRTLRGNQISTLLKRRLCLKLLHEQNDSVIACIPETSHHLLKPASLPLGYYRQKQTWKKSRFLDFSYTLLWVSYIFLLLQIITWVQF